MASESNNRTSNGFLTFVGVAGALVAVTVVAVGALAITGLGGETLEQKRAGIRIAVRTRLEKEAQEKLTSEGWVDKAKGLVHITVSDAIPLVVAELRNKKPAPSQVKVEPPLPIIAPDPNSKEPPPPLLPSQGADLIRFTPPSTPEAVSPAAAAPAAAAAAPAPVAPPVATPAPVPPKPAAPAPAVAPAPAPAALAPAPVPTPAPAPASASVPPAPESKPAPPPAAPQAVPPSAAPARPPLINPTENPAPTK